MIKLVMATNNANKLREASEILSPLGIEVISQRQAGADCDPEENGASFAENAMIKARAVHEAVGLPVIADDSGLCVDALNGEPGVYSARYAPDNEKCPTILKKLENVPDEERGAHFVCSIAYIDGNGKEKVVEGRCSGVIAHEEKGSGGFGYDPIFKYGDKTLAEMTPEEKNKISHRGSALRALYELLSSEEG